MSKVLFGDDDRADLEDDECVIVDWYIVSVLNIYEQIYREIREGNLKENAISDFAGKSFIHRRYFRSSWGMYKESLGDSFVSYFEAKLISEQPIDDIGQVTAVQHERSE
jgi:hypothetical protein